MDFSDFSCRNGILKLVKELGGEDMQIGSKAMKVVNDFTRDLTEKFLTTCNSGPMRSRREYNSDGKMVNKNNTLTELDLRTATSMIVLDSVLKGLQEDNARDCCNYGFGEKKKKTYRSGKAKEYVHVMQGKNDKIKFSRNYMRNYAKSFLPGYRIGEPSAESLTIRVQHLIGELIGMACTTAKDLGAKRITTRHIQLVLTYDKALEKVFELGDGKTQKPAAAIGAGMPDFDKSRAIVVARNITGTKSKGPANIFEEESVGPDMWACVNPYKLGSATNKQKKNACKKGGFARQGFEGVHNSYQPCTEVCHYK